MNPLQCISVPCSGTVSCNIPARASDATANIHHSCHGSNAREVQDLVNHVNLSLASGLFQAAVRIIVPMVHVVAPYFLPDRR